VRQSLSIRQIQPYQNLVLIVMAMIERIIYDAKWRLLRPQALAAWGRVMANEHKPVEQLWAEQERAKRELVEFAVKNIKFYREKYGEAGFEPGDMAQEGWFEKLPVVTKRDLREKFGDLVNPELKARMKISTTGGSTGEPTKVGYDGAIPEEIYSWRLQRWFGVEPWDDHAYVWRDTRSSRLAKFKNALMWWPTRHLKMDATFITEAGMREFLAKYNRLKPAMLQGYVGAVTQLAQFVVDQGIKVHAPKFVWTTSAPLPEAQRRLIVRAFNAPVCDQYGSCEIRWIAQQCPECGGLHVNTEHVNIEFADENNRPVPQGEYGKTLLTNLEDRVFPLIRYENGDRGRWLKTTCPCGRTLPIIDSVKGRESESFTLPSGKTINGEFLTTIFDGAPELVKGFRVVQHKDRSITVEYVPVAGDDSEVERLVKEFGGKLGGEVAVRAKPVATIAHDRGKLRFVVRER